MAAATAITVNTLAPWLTDSASNVFRVTATLDTASIVDGAQSLDTIAVTGVALGDMVVGFSTGVDLAGMTRTAYVSATNVVTVVTFNHSGGTVDLASTTVRALVIRPVF